MTSTLSKEDRDSLLKYHELGYTLTKNTIDSVKRNNKVGYKIIARINKTGEWKANARGQFSYNKMKVLGLTQEKVAKYFGVSRQALARYIRGEKTRDPYKVPENKINEFLDYVEYLSRTYSIKPSIVVERATLQKIIQRPQRP